MEEITKISIEEFEKKPDGSWVCIKNADINTKSNKIFRISPGIIFKKGVTVWGLDVVKTLDEISLSNKH